MKYCDKCKINVKSGSVCPLCQRRLKQDGGEPTFPKVQTMLAKHSLFFKLLIFASVAACIICVGINLIIPTKIFWSGFVVFGVICAWVDGIFSYKKLHNIPKTILYQVIIVSALSLLWDYFTGWRGWSLDYVIPFLCVAAILTMSALSWLAKLNLDDYTFYLFLYALFGIVPILFLIFNLVRVKYPSVTSIGVGILSFAGLVIFKGEYIWAELKNRLHL